MLWDILIAAGVAFTQLVITIYGVTLSVQEKRLKIAFIIGLVGVLGIGLTVWGAIRNGISQQKLEADLTELKKGQQTTNSGIEEIKTNPPVVNVSPPVVNVLPPTQAVHANVVLVAFQSSHNVPKTVNGVTISVHPLLVVGKPVMENFQFTNTGTATADKLGGYSRIYISGDSEENLTKKFKREFDTKKTSGGTLQAGGIEGFWFTAQSESAVTENDINQILDEKQHLYAFFAITYRDPNGTHYLHHCRLLQTPRREQLGEDPIWHFCKDFSEHR
jgi:hypothetical protein